MFNTEDKFVTPYKAAKLVNEKLTEDGIEKVIPAQMMYNYTTARLNKGTKPLITSTLEHGVSVEGLGEWYTKYSAKQTNKTEEVQTVES